MRRTCALWIVGVLLVCCWAGADAQVTVLGHEEPAWQAGHHYASSEVVTFDGAAYKCVYAHTAVAGWEPPKAAVLWQSLGMKQTALAATSSGNSSHASHVRRTFAPYVHMSETNNDLAAIQAASGIKFFTLAFIVSDGDCSPAWQGKAPLPIATESLFSSYIDRIRKSKGDVIISFGGYVGQELAQACPDAVALAAAYQRVIDKYKVKSLDFDVEASAASDPPSIDRRSEALERLARANPGLQISFTVPAIGTGMPQTALDLLKSAKTHKVPVSVVNIMTMDYGDPVANGNMGPRAIVVVDAALSQMRSLGLTAGVGIIPMIGMNDTPGETFNLDDARSVMAYARSNSKVRRLSMWSVGRDNGSCTGTVSPTCSGIAQSAWEFSHIFDKD